MVEIDRDRATRLRDSGLSNKTDILDDSATNHNVSIHCGNDFLPRQ